MVRLKDYNLVFAVVILIAVLLIASPAIAELIHVPGGEQFSELYLLGPERMAENYPYNIAVGKSYSVYAGIRNHLGSLAYYVLYVKFGSQSDPIPNSTLDSPSSLPTLNEYLFSIPDGMSWERLLTFSVSNAAIEENNSQINTLQINDASFNVNKFAMWNSNSTIFTYSLFFELWRYNIQSSSIQFDNRFVSLNLNLTRIP